MTIEKLKSAYEAATSGKWGSITCYYPHDDWANLYSTKGKDHGDGKMIAQLNRNGVGDANLKDAEFIALAHNMMPLLLEAVEALEAIRDAHHYDRDELASMRWQYAESFLNKLKGQS